MIVSALPPSPAVAILRALAFIVGLCLPSLASAASYRWNSVPIHGGGFVTGLEFHPTETGLLYARTDVAGTFRYAADDGRWIGLNDDIGGLDNAFMELGSASVALDPQDPDRVYLACGQYVAWWAPDATVLRSTDRGATWQRTTLPFNLDGNSDGRNTGENLVVDPHLGSVLLLGTPDAGLWRSTDHGTTFAQLSGFPAGNVTWLLFDRRSGTPGNATRTIYAGLAVPGPDSPSVYRSTDAGATWSALPGQPTALPVGGGDPPPPAQPIPQQAALAYDATGRLFITYGNALGPNNVTAGAVWRHDTATGAWDDVTPAPAPPSGQGGFGGVSVSAQNPAVVAVSTLGRWWPGDEIYRSTDGGATWSSRLRSGTLDHSSAPWAASLNPHWIGDVEIDPANADRALFVTGYGLFQTLNFSAAAPTWTFHNAGLEETVPTGLVSPSSGPDLISVIGDFDGFRHDDVTSPTTPPNRHTPSHGTNRSLALAPLAPTILARTFHGAEGAPRGAYSIDGAATWTDFATSPSTAKDAGPGQIAINADGTRFVWIQPDLVPHLSTDNGASWTPATGSVPAGSHTPVADALAPLRFYVYDAGAGILHRSTDGGASFSAAATGLPTGANPPVPALGREGDLWLAAWNQGLRRSTDAGATFTTVSSVQRAYRLGFGRAAEGANYPAIYLWGRVGDIDALWRSIDTGATWERINDDARTFGHINVIVGDPRRFGRVYIGSYGIRYGEPDDTPPPVLTLPEGWAGRDIGGPALAGAAGETDGTFTLRGSGADIWGGSDQFHFASRLASGDAGIVTRVTSLANTDTWAKAGVMFRAGLAADAPFVALFQRPDRQVTLQWRTTAGADAEAAGSGLFGNTTDLKWLRLQRDGDTFTAAYSSDGATWTTLAATPAVVLPLDAELGLALTSHNSSALGTATFTNVALIPEPLAVTTVATLPGASAGLAYATTLAARGGFPGRVWTLDAGALPPGLALDPATGGIGGTPTATGDFTFTARATDADGATAARAFSLTVQGLPYASWLSGYFTPSEQNAPLLGGSISADPDADTLPNLAEWALGLDPRAPDAAGALSFAVTPGSASGASELVVTFTRRRAAPGVAWAVETTTDLAAPAWTHLPEGDPSWTVADDASGLTQTVTVRIPMSTARVFARLRLTQN